MSKKNIFIKMWNGFLTTLNDFAHWKENEKKARKTAEEAELIFLDKKWNGSYITFGARLWCSKQEASVYEETGNSIMFTPTHASAFYKLNENSRMGTTVDKDPENFYIQGTIKCTKGGNCIINNCGADEWEETSDVMIEEGEALILDSYCCCCENKGILRFLSTGQEPEVLTFISSYFNPASRKLAKITYTGFSLYGSGGTLIGAIKEGGVLRITTSTIGFAGDTRGIISDLTGVDTCQEFGGGLVGENGAKEKVGKIFSTTCDIGEFGNSLIGYGVNNISENIIKKKKYDVEAENIKSRA